MTMIRVMASSAVILLSCSNSDSQSHQLDAATVDADLPSRDAASDDAPGDATSSSDAGAGDAAFHVVEGKADDSCDHVCAALGKTCAAECPDMGFSTPKHAKSAESGYYGEDAGGGVLYKDRFEIDCTVVMTTTWQPPLGFGDYSLVYDFGNPVGCCCQL